MKCSLIIPAYNAGRTLDTCLRSAFDQSLPLEAYEVIVVDDGSTDNTPEVAGGFPVILLRQQNSGPAAARNAGVRQATGEILIFTDSDCELDREFLKNMIAPFKKNEIIGVQGVYKTEQTEFMANFGQVEIEGRYVRLAHDKYIDFIGTYAAAYRRDVFNDNDGFNESFPLASGEDTEFSYKLQKQGHKMVFNPAAFVYHRHPSTLKHYLRTKFYRGYWRIGLYSLHPEKTIKDSYTPQSLKIQVLTMPLVLASLLLSVVNPTWLWCVVIAAVCYVLWSIPFAKRFHTRHMGGIWKLPFILIARAAALGAGLAVGFLQRIYAIKGN